MGKIKFFLLTVLALNVIYLVVSVEPNQKRLNDPNRKLMENMIELGTTFLSLDKTQTYNLTTMLPNGLDNFAALGTMRGIFVIKVIWKLSFDNEKKKMADIYLTHANIYKELNAKHPCSKWDMMDKFGLPFFFPRVIHEKVKFYGMPALSVDLKGILRASNTENPQSQLNMLPNNELTAFATQVVKTIGTLHDIDYALGKINSASFMLWEFVGQDGTPQKRYITVDLKSVQSITDSMAKRNWLEFLEVIAEAMGAFERTADYGLSIKTHLLKLKWESLFKQWKYPSDIIKVFMKAQLNYVLENGVLSEYFVENFNSQLKAITPTSFRVPHMKNLPNTPSSAASPGSWPNPKPFFARAASTGVWIKPFHTPAGAADQNPWKQFH